MKYSLRPFCSLRADKKKSNLRLVIPFLYEID